MITLLKNIISFIKKQRKLLFLVVVLTFLMFFLRFPWTYLLEKTVRDFQKKSPPSLQTDFDNLHFSFFPPGIEFKNLFVDYKRKTTLLDSFKISIVLSKWLAFKKAFKVKAVQDNSSLFVEFWKKEKIMKDDPEEQPVIIYFIKGYSPLLDLKALNSMFPNMKMSGVMKTRFDYTGSPRISEENKAFLNLTGEAIRLSQMEIQTPLGPLDFPSIQWKEGEIVLHLKKEELVFKTFRLGSPSDDLFVQMKGSASVFFSYGRIRLNSYDVQLQVDLNKGFQMSLLDIMFAGYKEDKGTFYRYKARLTGKGNQVPNMDKLSEF